MDQKALPRFPSPLRTVSLVLLVMLLGIHSVLLAAIIQRTTSGRMFARQVESLRANVEYLEFTLSERESEISSELTRAELALQTLRANPPELHPPEELINSAFNLSALDSVQLNNVTRVGYSQRETSFGIVALNTYRFEGQGKLPGCLSFLARLEGSWEPTLASENVLIEPQAEVCSFDVLLMSPGTGQ